MYEEHRLFDEELVPELEALGPFTVVSFWRESQEVTMDSVEAITDVMDEAGAPKLWAPRNFRYEYIHIRSMLPTHLVIPEGVAEDSSWERLYQQALAAINIDMKHIEIRDEAVEGEMREFAGIWERESKRDRVAFSLKGAVEVSSVSFTVVEGISRYRAREDGGLSAEGLERVLAIMERVADRFDAEMDALSLPTELVNLMLVLAGEKNGTFIGSRFPETELVTELAELLSEMGVHCATRVIRHDGYDPVVLLCVTKSDYGLERYRQLFDMVGREASDEEDRMFAQFFGYPDEEIEAWIESRKHGEDYGAVVPPATVAEARGWEPDRLKKLDLLVNFLIRDDDDALEQAWELTEHRYERLHEIEERYGVEILAMVEKYGGWEL